MEQLVSMKWASRTIMGKDPHMSAGDFARMFELTVAARTGSSVLFRRDDVLAAAEKYRAASDSAGAHQRNLPQAKYLDCCQRIESKLDAIIGALSELGLGLSGK